jgi:TusA-related sulfurtransferase
MTITETILKFLEEPLLVDSKTDVVYMMCPMHLLNMQQGMREIKMGQTLAVLTDYDGALDDIPDWCEFEGQELLGVYEHDDYYEFYIRKQKEM